ncbi:hypothetical protein LINPERPRIM_LOCUS30753 [Linum perenne]
MRRRCFMRMIRSSCFNASCPSIQRFIMGLSSRLSLRFGRICYLLFTT